MLFFTCNSGCCSPMCVPCGDFALKAPQLFLLSAQLLPAVGGEKGEKEVTAAAHCKFLFCLAAPSLPPSSASEEEEEAVKTSRPTDSLLFFPPPAWGGIRQYSLFLLLLFCMLPPPLWLRSPPPAEKKSTTSLFPPLHTGFFLSIRGREQGKTKKIFPLPIRSFGVKRKRKKGKFLCHVVVVFVVTPGWGKKSAAFFRICGKKAVSATISPIFELDISFLLNYVRQSMTSCRTRKRKSQRF